MCRSVAADRHDRNFVGRPGDDSLPFLAVGPGNGLCGVDREADARIAENAVAHVAHDGPGARRSEEHTSELPSLMRISSAGFCLKKKKQGEDNAENYTEQTHNTHHVGDDS